MVGHVRGSSRNGRAGTLTLPLVMTWMRRTLLRFYLLVLSAPPLLLLAEPPLSLRRMIAPNSSAEDSRPLVVTVNCRRWSSLCNRNHSMQRVVIALHVRTNP